VQSHGDLARAVARRDDLDAELAGDARGQHAG
jgi:hypothetical protein